MVRNGRRWKGWLGYAIAAAAIFYAWDRAGLDASRFVRTLSELEPSAVLLSLGLFLVHGAMNAVAYGCLLSAATGRALVPEGARAWAASVLAKYVPGGVWQALGRIGWLEASSVPVKTVVSTSVYEQAISLAACLALAGAAALVGGGYALSLFVLSGAVVTVLAFLRRGPGSAGPYAFLRASALYTAALGPYFVAYAVLVRPEATAGFLLDLMLGTVAGVLALFAPGGLGVREAWMSFQQVQAGGDLLAVLVFARGLIVVSEVLLFIGALAMGGPALRARREQERP